MLIITKLRGLDAAEADEDILRLTSLTADLCKIREGRGPTEADLQSAPILNNWTFEVGPAFCLIGEVSGHPLLPGTGRPITTSNLWALAPDAGWARTRSRWYRLGRPFGTVADQ